MKPSAKLEMKKSVLFVEGEVVEARLNARHDFAAAVLAQPDDLAAQGVQDMEPA